MVFSWRYYLKKSIDEILEMIINREISIRRASRDFGYTRDVIRSSLLKKYGNSEEVLEILNENKINSTTIEIPQELLKEVFFKAMNKEITFLMFNNVIIHNRYLYKQVNLEEIYGKKQNQHRRKHKGFRKRYSKDSKDSRS